MAESVDALVSNTSGATRAGSTPALGTKFSESEVLQVYLQHFFYVIFLEIQQQSGVAEAIPSLADSCVNVIN